MAAPYSATASMVRSMVATSMSGRTASCTSTMSSASAGRALSALATDSWRFSPPSTTRTRSGKTVLGHLRLDALHLRLAHGHVDRRDARRRGKGAQRMNEDGHAIQREKLLGLRAGHPGTQSGSGKNDKDLHGSAEYSTGRAGGSALGCARRAPNRQERKSAVSLCLNACSDIVDSKGAWLMIR